MRRAGGVKGAAPCAQRSGIIERGLIARYAPPLPLDASLLYIHEPLPKRLRYAALPAHNGQHDILHVHRLYLHLYPSLSSSFRRTSSTRAATAAAAFPPDSRGGYDDCCGTDAEDLAQGPACRCREELGHRQGTLGDVYVVERPSRGQLGERGGEGMVREEGEDRGARHAREDRAVQRGRHYVERCRIVSKS